VKYGQSRSGVAMYFARSAAGEVVDVTQVERGANCLCTCLGCNATVVSKQGPKKAWHFSHAADAEALASCGESALHAAGKAVLVSLGSVLIPELSVTVTRQDVLNRELVLKPVRPAGTFRYSHCQLEVSHGSRRLDAVLADNTGAQLGVEIRVHHEVDMLKKLDLSSSGMTVLEIDLHPLLGQSVCWDDVRAAVRTDAARQMVAGLELYMEPLVAAARAQLEKVVDDLAQSMGEVIFEKPGEEDKAAALCDKYGLIGIPNLEELVDWCDFIQDQALNPSVSSARFHRLFGVHHSIWQSMAIGFAMSMRGKVAFPVHRVLEFIWAELGGQSKNFYEEEAAVISYRNQFDRPTTSYIDRL